MKKWLYLLLLTPALQASAQYPVSEIPDSLLKKANAVLRYEETRVTVHSVSSASVYTKQVYTILNEAGLRHAGFVAYYDKFRKLGDVHGKLFDASGRLLRQVKKKEMEDVAYSDNFSLAQDGRLKKFDFYARNYPFTVEFEVEKEYNGLYALPGWQPLDNYDCSVQQSVFTAAFPEDYRLRYKLLNGAPDPVVTVKDKRKNFTWEAKGIPACQYAPYQPSISTWAMGVLLGPDDFEYAGYRGNLSSWEQFGRFFSELYRGRDVLPMAVKEEVKRLTEGVSDRRGKINRLYTYLQQNTHYISIQLGIGGLQPFDAAFVAEKKYGDCKALSNYMVSLLREAGISAYNALIYGGRNAPQVYEDFPADYFNHVVVCVPGEQDSIWLECTSQTVSAGYAGTFTGNRKALLITEQGGKLVHTPHYRMDDNQQHRVIRAEINANGDLHAESVTRFTGIQQELQHQLLHEVNREEREKYLNQTLNLPTYHVSKIEYRESKGPVPAMEETLVVESAGYASVTGKRLFIQPNLFNKTRRLPEDRNRLQDIVFQNSYRDVDSVIISIPAGYTVESLPAPVTEKNQFGIYRMACSVQGNQLLLSRTWEQPEGRFSAAAYPALVAFYDVMAKADHAKVVMVKE